MSSGLLSLKWNNHRSTFFHVLSSIRSKESYCDATLACDGRFYPVHKLVLSTCSEYFEQIFERTQCKHPVIVLKDIKFDDLEALMNYMYVGEVNVLQEKLAGLIKAAECLKIKGLAVPDEDPLSSSKRIPGRLEADSPHAKRRRREDSYSYEERERNSSSRSSRLSQRDQQIPQLETRVENSQIDQTSVDATITDNHSQAIDSESEQHDSEQKSHRAKHSNNESGSHRLSSQKPAPEVSIDETSVKSEPPDIQEDVEEDSKETLHSNLGYDPSGDADSINANPASVASGSNEAPYSDSNMLDSTPQSVEDVVAQAIPPTSSSFQGNSFSLWEGEGSLQNFPGEGYSGENSQGRPMVSQASQGETASEKSPERSISPLPLCEIAYSDNELNPKTFPMCEVDDEEDSMQHEKPALAIAAIHQQGAMIQFSPQQGSSVHVDYGDLHNKGFQCSFCNKSFPSIPLFNEHLLSHPSDIMITCPICTVQISQRDILLTRHVQNHMEESTQGRKALTDEYSMSRKRFACSLCPYRAFNRSNLVIHTRMHTGEKPFGCSECSYRANHKGNLVTHMRTHAGMKQYVCFICHKKFTDKRAMQQHTLLFHPTGGNG